MIQRSLAGDKAAYEQLVLKYQNRLLHAVFPVARNTEDALDVVQEAFVQAYVRLDSFRQNSQFYTWLYRIAFNIALGQRRKQRPHYSLQHPGLEMSEEPVDEDSRSPLEQLGMQEMSEILWDAIGDLEEEYQSVIVLREMEGHSYEEIALILELPIGTVRSRLHRARNLLRIVLQRHERNF
ncbi:MAG: sigma-70 family RNA polymerase sigma factor [Thermoguttaceae bacterium]